MCGIAGGLAWKGERSDTLRRAVDDMCSTMSHRGPDAGGMWADAVCVLGHRRLAVVDLSLNGNQPLANEDEQVWVTFNGEIYNARALRAELQSDHTFRGQSDTEVIVHAYERWGEDCVHRLRGMFAFGIWDQRAEKLFLARDRLGKKPLFYWSDSCHFLFASSVGALVASGFVSRSVDPAAVDAYLSWGYVPAPRSGLRGVWKLPPAGRMAIDRLRPAAVEQQPRYWQLPYRPKLAIGREEAAELVRDKVVESVRMRTESDVPLGAFLSGGVDSSIVVGILATLSSSAVKTFSVGFENERMSELHHARRIADRWQTDHHEMVVKADVADILRPLVRQCGEPYADSSLIPTFYVSQAARRHVTVALTGDGGDESFAGYSRYRLHALAERARRFPGAASLARRAATTMAPRAESNATARRAHGALLGVAGTLGQRQQRWASYFREEEKRGLYTEEFSRELSDPPWARSWLDPTLHRAEGLDAADAAMSVEVDSTLPYDLLVKTDIASMASGLEARSPFLDHELMELAARLPVGLKLRGNDGKHILKYAFRDMLPAENVRRPKMGLSVPLTEWLVGPLAELVQATLGTEQFLGRGYFNRQYVKSLLGQLTADEGGVSAKVWSLLILEIWWQETVEGLAPGGPYTGDGCIEGVT